MLVLIIQLKCYYIFNLYSHHSAYMFFSDYVGAQWEWELHGKFKDVDGGFASLVNSLIWKVLYSANRMKIITQMAFKPRWRHHRPPNTASIVVTYSPLGKTLLGRIKLTGGSFTFSLRVTGKMVGTASHESVQAGTKLLDIPLNPENNMTAL